MSMSPEERRLIHQKGQQPTYGTGVPEENSGSDGDISYRKVGKETIQYLKQDGKWVEVSSSDNAGNISSENFGNEYIGNDSDFLRILRKYRSTISNWGQSWSKTSAFQINYSNDGGSPPESNGDLNWFQWVSEETANDRANNVLIVPKSCILSNINFLITTAQDSAINTLSYGFRLHFYTATILHSAIYPSDWEYLEFPHQNNGTGIHDFNVEIEQSGTKGMVNLPIQALLNTSGLYSIAVEQINFPDGNNSSKGSIWHAFFDNV